MCSRTAVSEFSKKQTNQFKTEEKKEQIRPISDLRLLRDQTNQKLTIIVFKECSSKNLKFKSTCVYVHDIV